MTSQKRDRSLLLQKYDEVAKKLAQVESELERAEERAETGETKVHTVKKVNGFPIPSHLPNSPLPRIHPLLGTGKWLTFLQCRVLCNMNGQDVERLD
jgi:hypothetical protein